MNMKITNKIDYSDNITIISTSYPDDKYPNYFNYQELVNRNSYLYFINMSLKSYFKAHWHFPTTEIKGIQSINTLLVINKIFEVIKEFNSHTTFIINCDAGSNRSFNVVECFRYLKTGEVNECFNHFKLPHILEYVKMVEDGENIERIIGLYTSKLFNIGILNAIKL